MDDHGNEIVGMDDHGNEIGGINDPRMKGRNK